MKMFILNQMSFVANLCTIGQVSQWLIFIENIFVTGVALIYITIIGEWILDNISEFSLYRNDRILKLNQRLNTEEKNSCIKRIFIILNSNYMVCAWIEKVRNAYKHYLHIWMTFFQNNILLLLWTDVSTPVSFWHSRRFKKAARFPNWMKLYGNAIRHTVGLCAKEGSVNP